MHTQWESLANTHILGIAPYEPGKPIEETEREYGVHDAIKLASNENPLAPSERVQRAIAAQLAHLNRYPDGSGFYLRKALEKEHGVPPDHAVLGKGSNELMEWLVRTFLRPGDEAVVPPPSFVVYPMIVQAAGGVRVMVMLKEHRLDLEAMARAITPMTKMVFVANPNNPTATIVTADEVEHFMARVPERTIVVFDEAYIEFALGPDFPETLTYVRQGRKVVVLRTFSKAASLAGLRVGYGVADADAIALMNRIRQPFNVNSLAQAAALAALEDDSHILECVRMIEAGRHFLYDEFKTLGVQYGPAPRRAGPRNHGRRSGRAGRRLCPPRRPGAGGRGAPAARVVGGAGRRHRDRRRLDEGRDRTRRRPACRAAGARICGKSPDGGLRTERLRRRAGRPFPGGHGDPDADRPDRAACREGRDRVLGGDGRARERVRR